MLKVYANSGQDLVNKSIETSRGSVKLPRAVEIPCLTCPTWSYFIQDKLKFSIYFSLDKCKICIKLIKFCISYFD